MLYMCVGNDIVARKAKVAALMCVLENKRPNSQIILLDGEQNNLEYAIEQNISGQGLFDEKSIIKGLNLCEEKKIKDFIFTHLVELVKSPNAFILSEGTLTAPEIKNITQAGAEVYTFQTTKNKVDTLFYLGDLLLQKNKSQLWVALSEELNGGKSIEELFGIIMWQVKALHLAKTLSQVESGLKPFVYNKCTKTTWGRQETKNLHSNLLFVYHQSRRGGLNTREQLEKIILNL